MDERGGRESVATRNCRRAISIVFAMVIWKRWIKVVVVIGAWLPFSHADAFNFWSGPMLANGGASEAEFAVMQSDGQLKSLGEVRPGISLVVRAAVPPGAIRVTSNGRQFELDETQRARQALDLRQPQQVWVFDGERVCVIDNHLMPERGVARCPNIANSE